MEERKGEAVKEFLIVALMSFWLVLTNAAIADEVKAISETAQSIEKNTQVSRSETIESKAKRWSLDANEYQDYLELMKGPLGTWSPGIDPLLALGMFAQSEQEERRYAELYAQQEFVLTQRALRFQQAYRQAFSRIYPNTGILDKQLLEPYFYHQQKKSENREARFLLRQRIIEGDRLLVFVPPSCNQCSRLITQLMGLVSSVPNSGVDLYVLNSIEDAAVRNWAQANHIQPGWLSNKRLTLNKNEGLLERLQSHASIQVGKKISIFLKRNNSFFQINIKDFEL